MDKFLMILLTLVSFGCSSGDDSTPPPRIGGPSDSLDPAEPSPEPDDNSIIYNPVTSLKEAASFPIGNVVSASKLTAAAYTDFRNVLEAEFNSLTAENDMKMANMFPAPATYDFSDGDAIVAYAREQGMRVFGHALIWHSSIPGWLRDFQGTDAEFEAEIEAYIKAAVSHFAAEKMTVGNQNVSVVAGWDVVNEALTSDAENAIFRQRMGPDYVGKCFQWAREADPDVLLFYNDYNLESDQNKTDGLIAMVNNFQATGVPIDGIGMQMHIHYQYPDQATIENNLNRIAGTGLLIHFSEIDMTVNRDLSLTELTPERAQAQEERFREVTALYNSLPASQRFGMTFWGLRDNESWLLNFHNNQNEWPLLFTKDYEYKLAHRGVVSGLQ